MDFAKVFDLHILSIIILIFLLINNSRWNQFDLSGRLFKYVVIAMLFNTILDFAGWFFILSEMTSSFAINVNFYLNTFIYATLAIPMSFWVLYIDYKIYNDEDRLKRYWRFYFAPVFLLIVLSAVNIYTGIIFSIGSDGIYSRGPLFYVVVIIMYLIPVWSIVMVLRKRKTVSTRLLESILQFWILPILAALVQMFFYGWMITWPVFNIVTLFAYILVEKDAMLKDNLTQLDSRKVFEDNANEMIKRKTAFALVLIDLNDFKSINDTYGHEEGDQALVSFSNILRASVKGNDLICRYGGDEFIALIPCTGGQDEVSYFEKRLVKNLMDYNGNSNKPYDIKMSYGYNSFSDQEAMNLKDRIKMVDEKMYDQKKKLK